AGRARGGSGGRPHRRLRMAHRARRRCGVHHVPARRDRGRARLRRRPRRRSLRRTARHPPGGIPGGRRPAAPPVARHRPARRAIARRGAGWRRLLDGGAPLDYPVPLVDDPRDQLPRLVPPVGAGVLVLAATITTTVAVTPHLTVLVATVLIVAVALAMLLAIR